MRFVFQKEETAEQSDGENNGAENAVLQISAENGSHKTRDGGTGGTAEVTREGKQGKHGGAAEFHTLRCQRERSRPKDSDGKSTDDASDQGDHGIRGKTNDQIADDAKDRAKRGSMLHRNLFAEFRIKNAGDTHRNSEPTGTEKISDCFIDAESAFRKGGYPLCDGKLGSTCTDHHDQHEPENLLGKQLFIIGLVVFLFTDREKGNGGEEKDIEKWNERKQAGEKLPMLDADEHEERRAGEDGSNDTPAIEGVQKAHDSRLVFRRARLDDRADEDLKQTAADRVYHGGD